MNRYFEFIAKVIAIPLSLTIPHSEPRHRRVYRNVNPILVEPV